MAAYICRTARSEFGVGSGTECYWRVSMPQGMMTDEQVQAVQILVSNYMSKCFLIPSLQHFFNSSMPPISLALSKRRYSLADVRVPWPTFSTMTKNDRLFVQNVP